MRKTVAKARALTAAQKRAVAIADAKAWTRKLSRAKKSTVARLGPLTWEMVYQAMLTARYTPGCAAEVADAFDNAQARVLNQGEIERLRAELETQRAQASSMAAVAAAAESRLKDAGLMVDQLLRTLYLVLGQRQSGK